MENSGCMEDILEKYLKIQEGRRFSGDNNIIELLNNYDAESLEERLRELKSPFIEELKDAHEKIVSYVSKWTGLITDVVGRVDGADQAFFVTTGIFELCNCLLSIHIAANSGLFRMAIKEFRDALEWLVTTTFVDRMYPLRQAGRKGEEAAPMPALYLKLIESGDWSRKLEGKGHLHRIYSIGTFSEEVRRRVIDPNMDYFKAYSVNNLSFERKLIEKLTFPLLVYSAGDIRCEQHAGRENKYKMKFKDFKNHLLVDIANVISHLKWNRDISKSMKLWEALLDEVSKGPMKGVKFSYHRKCDQCEMDSEDNYFSLRLPTVEFMMAYLDQAYSIKKNTGFDVRGLYGQLCSVVHPSGATQQYSPFYSIEEVTLWTQELDCFLSLVDYVIEQHLKFLESPLS